MAQRVAIVALSALLLAVTAGTASAASTPGQRCAAAKAREACKKQSCKLRCHARAARRGTPVDTFCLSRCEAKFSSRMDRIEARGGCATTNDKAAIEAKVDAFVDDVSVELTGSPTGALLTTAAARRCGTRKLAATGRKACAKLRCHARAKMRGTTVDPACLQRAEFRFTRAFSIAESRGGCATTNDRAAIEAKVDAFVADVVVELPSSTVTTTTTTVPPLCGNGVINPPEDCDPPGSITCPPGSPAGAFLACNANCTCPAAPTTTTVGPTTTTIATLPTTTTMIGTTTTVLPGSTTTTTCCPAVQIVTTTAEGRLTVDSLNAFNFPAGVLTVINAGTADAMCQHPVSVEQFDVPPFCIQGLGYTSDVFPLGCAVGTALGNGSVWDATAPCADADINRSADTSDGSCNPAGQPCNTAAGGAGANTLGNIDTTRGDTLCDAAGVQTRLDIPVRSLTWSDGDGSADCPDEDGVYNPGQDNTITDFNFILSPTTSRTQAQYLDQNLDGCSFSGGGPQSTRVCSNDFSRPCSFPIDCAVGGTCNFGPLVGDPATGPCCTVGQATTVVATGAAFTGAGPLYDLIFANSSPATISACNAPQPLGSCTLSTDPCQD